MTEEQFLHSKHWENEGIQFSQSTLANVSRAFQDSNSGLFCASATNRRKRDRERVKQNHTHAQTMIVANEWRGSGRSLVEHTKRLSFDGPADEIKFRGRARRQESGTHGRWKWTALFGQRNKNIYLHRRSFASWNDVSIDEKFHRYIVSGNSPTDWLDRFSN